MCFIFFSDVLFYEYVIANFFFNLWRLFVLSKLEKRDHTFLQVSRLDAERKTRKQAIFEVQRLSLSLLKREKAFLWNWFSLENKKTLS